MSPPNESAHSPFKGIALFTPGGDLVYCIDADKQARWHLNLCAALQEVLGLPEPPHFLVPCYTATVDRWIDQRHQHVQTIGEISPLVARFAPLLNVIFETPDLTWRTTVLPGGVCDPLVLSSYRSQFPQLWQNHDLLLHYQVATNPVRLSTKATLADAIAPEAQGYVLRLFISGNNLATERTLHNLHRLLEECLQQPYTLKVIDVRQHPDMAEADQISATPTLLKAYPLPVRRIVGSLENAEQLQGLFENQNNDWETK
ncbi:MAG TPA: circadian clock KaiB family protein [Leptolyngbyaceae cyanobacterium M33_DOE_097]|uniref:Circadian clock protein KaiB n=1 Tax=Oscillatoriales cyanobacterium SpSt-418 TaxID=2282169 RepID=A0A7C3PKV2_9CYAN|nr:circadian clock KaiB family protein [Leptolyngbyaceae cyanobacterium M33_DOE_097]